MRTTALILCLITDRRRLAAACGVDVDRAASAVFAQAAGAVAAGVDVLHVREPDLEAGALSALVRGCLAIAAGTTTRVVVNDRVDVAIAAGADGVHLRERSVPVAAARRLVRAERLVGRSVHDTDGARRARDADYLIAGNAFPTASKPGIDTSLGRSGLADIVDAAGACPVWAVGGITLECADLVRSSGVAGVAAIGAFIAAVPLSQLGQSVETRARQLRFALTVNRGVL